MHRLLAIPFALLFCLNALAQRDIPENLPKFDNRWAHFGFQLGISNNGFRLDHNIALNDSLINMVVENQPGFVIHVVSELHLGKFFGLRFTPGIAFAARNINYTFYKGENQPSLVVKRTIESTYIESPLLLKFRSKRVNNFAQYVMVGFNYSLDLASQEFVDNQVDALGEYLVKLRRHNYNIELGVGFDFFLEYFKFTPELKFSYGLNNVVVNDQTIYSKPITELHSRIFVLAFNFEG
ncbi:MAG: porin family protein [Salibacteraceae bacterium]